jgi:hypothetical protein
VRIALDLGQYGIGDTFHVTISNESGGAIKAADHQSNCTILHPQYAVNDSWQLVNKCLALTATRIIGVAAGSTSRFDLAPPGSGTPGWQTGTYRVQLSYMTGTDRTAGQLGTAYSPTFIVG